MNKKEITGIVINNKKNFYKNVFEFVVAVF
jgi:hypothetical protein